MNLKKKIYNTATVVLIAIAAAITVGAVGKDIVSAAESGEKYVPISYGRFVYDDGDASNNNGNVYDLLIDAADFDEMAEHINKLSYKTNELAETAVRKNDVIDTLEEIKVNTDNKKAAGANAVKELIQAFQAGVNKIYDKLAGLGFTPITNSPDDIYNAIQNMYDNRYEEGKNSVEITQNLKYYTWQVADTAVPSRFENNGNGITLTSPTAEEMFGSGYILIGVSYINAPALAFGGIKGVNYSGFGTTSGTVNVKFATDSENTEPISYTSIIIMGYKKY